MLRPLLIAIALVAPAAAALAPGLAPGLASPASESPVDVLRATARAAGLELPAPDLAALRVGTLREEMLQLYALGGVTLGAQGLADLDAFLAAVPQGAQAPVARILAAMHVARLLHAHAIADVTDGEIAYAAGFAEHAAPTPAEQAVLADIAARLDLPVLARAGALVAAALQASMPELRAVAAPEDFDAVDPTGAVQITGTGASYFLADRQLQVDLGGDDVWANDAGGAYPLAIVEAFPGCVTTGAVECTLLNPNRQAGVSRALLGRACSSDPGEATFRLNDDSAALVGEIHQQAAVPDPDAALGFLMAAPPGWAARFAANLDPQTGCSPQGTDDLTPWLMDVWQRGVLTDQDAHFVVVAVDVAGNDVFAPPKNFNFMNDGRNPSGCDSRAMGSDGLLWSRNVTGGAAFASIGLLWDGGGSDAYGGRSIAQGAGHVGGIGMLVDEGAGDDRYEAVRFAQGLGFFASLGLLYDEAGNDRYALRNLVPLWNEFEHFTGCDVSTRDGQGRSNFNAIAGLVDGAGDDAYAVQDHIAEGLFLPGAGRDDPTTTQGSTGFRLNIGPSYVNDAAGLGRGLLLDRGGADAYTRAGRADGCLDTAGSFWDQGASLSGSLGPCAAG